MDVPICALVQTNQYEGVVKSQPYMRLPYRYTFHIFTGCVVLEDADLHKGSLGSGRPPLSLKHYCLSIALIFTD